MHSVAVGWRMEVRSDDSHVSLAAEDELPGRYSNFFSIGHNALEFVVDFGEMYNGTRERMHSRIVMNPSCAKELMRVLELSVRSFESQFGEIPDRCSETGAT